MAYHFKDAPALVCACRCLTECTAAVLWMLLRVGGTRNERIFLLFFEANNSFSCVLLFDVQFGLQVDQIGLQAQVSNDVSAVKEGINVYQVGPPPSSQKSIKPPRQTQEHGTTGHTVQARRLLTSPVCVIFRCRPSA